MSRPSRVLSGVIVVLLGYVTIASAQLVVTDPGVTIQNAIVAVIKEQMLDTAAEQARRIRRMARRLSAHTNLDKYAIPNPPRWRIHSFLDDGTFLYANLFNAALNYGDPGGVGFEQVARRREPVRDELASFGEDDLAATSVIRAELATLDAADSAIIIAADQAGKLRYNGRKELAAINALEQDTVDPSGTQSATAVLDKISGASLIRARLHQGRIELLASLVEQLLIDNKRTRDAETGAMNMELERLRHGSIAQRNLLRDAAIDLRSWRQP